MIGYVYVIKYHSIFVYLIFSTFYYIEGIFFSYYYSLETEF